VHSRTTGPASHKLVKKCAIALRDVDGRVLDMSSNFYPEVSPPDQPGLMEMAVQCLRFFNCDMYYSDEALKLLERALDHSSYDDRRIFFSECLRLRRRERNLWSDTPLAKFLTPREEWHLLRPRATLEKLQRAVMKAIKRRQRNKLNPFEIFRKFDTNNDGAFSTEELQRCFKMMNLPFALGDFYAVTAMFEKNEHDGSISLAAFKKGLNLPDENVLKSLQPRDPEVQGGMQCPMCTLWNEPWFGTCTACGYPWEEPLMSPDKWACKYDTFWNPKSEFYCAQCDRARDGYQFSF